MATLSREEEEAARCSVPFLRWGAGVPPIPREAEAAPKAGELGVAERFRARGVRKSGSPPMPRAAEDPEEAADDGVDGALRARGVAGEGQPPMAAEASGQTREAPTFLGVAGADRPPPLIGPPLSERGALAFPAGAGGPPSLRRFSASTSGSKTSSESRTSAASPERFAPCGGGEGTGAACKSVDLPSPGWSTTAPLSQLEGGFCLEGLSQR